MPKAKWVLGMVIACFIKYNVSQITKAPPGMPLDVLTVSQNHCLLSLRLITSHTVWKNRDILFHFSEPVTICLSPSGQEHYTRLLITGKKKDHLHHSAMHSAMNGSRYTFIPKTLITDKHQVFVLSGGTVTLVCGTFQIISSCFAKSWKTETCNWSGSNI